MLTSLNERNVSANAPTYCPLIALVSKISNTSRSVTQYRASFTNTLISLASCSEVNAFDK